MISEPPQPHVRILIRFKTSKRTLQVQRRTMLRLRTLSKALCNRPSVLAQCALSTSSAGNPNLEHCLELLKQHDLERSYLQLAFVPSELRFALEIGLR